jgi:PPOX class probable F420-dependent enzyme
MGGRSLSDEETEAVLKESKIAVICSQNKDGTIHAMPVWFKYIDDEVVVLTPSDSRKAKNIERDNRVTVLIEERDPVRGLMIYGEAEIDGEDPLPTAINLTMKYLAKENAKSFAEKAVKDAGLDLLIRIKPERIVSFHY